MQTRREYAISLGLAKPGRGRMSRDAHDAVNKAIAEGMRFSDVPEGNTSQEASKVKRAEEFFGDTPAQTYHGGWYVIDDGNRIDISGIEVCRTCMNSLDWHRCLTPTYPATNGKMLEVHR